MNNDYNNDNILTIRYFNSFGVFWDTLYKQVYFIAEFYSQMFKDHVKSVLCIRSAQVDTPMVGTRPLECY
jgi:hypothetical protein